MRKTFWKSWDLSPLAHWLIDHCSSGLLHKRALTQTNWTLLAKCENNESFGIFGEWAFLFQKFFTRNCCVVKFFVMRFFGWKRGGWIIIDAAGDDISISIKCFRHKHALLIFRTHSLARSFLSCSRSRSRSHSHSHSHSRTLSESPIKFLLRFHPSLLPQHRKTNFGDPWLERLNGWIEWLNNYSGSAESSISGLTSWDVSNARQLNHGAWY